MILVVILIMINLIIILRQVVVLGTLFPDIHTPGIVGVTKKIIVTMMTSKNIQFDPERKYDYLMILMVLLMMIIMNIILHGVILAKESLDRTMLHTCVVYVCPKQSLF